MSAEEVLTAESTPPLDVRPQPCLVMPLPGGSTGQGRAVGAPFAGGCHIAAQHFDQRF